MNWSQTEVAVTGAGGFIGSHLCDKLIQLGARVTAFVRYTSHGSAGFVPEGCSIVRGDLRDGRAIADALDGAHVMFHLGAVISVPYSFEYPKEIFEVNVLGSLSVLRAVQASGARLVMVSTPEVYGTAQYVPIDEKHPKNPQSPYAASKISSDALALAYHAVHGVNVVVVRPFNTYGPRQSDRAIIPALISQALYRDRIEVGNLDSTRDFTFVSDTVDGMVAAAASEISGQEINLGTGTERSVLQLLEKVLAATGKTLPVVPSAERVRSGSSEVRRLVSDNRKAQTLLGWSPKVLFAYGLEETVKFVRAHPEMYSPERYRS